MEPLARRTIALATLLVAGGTARASSLKDDPEVASQLRLLDEWTRTQVEYADLPGVVVGVVHDQEVVWLKAYGMADVDRKVPMRADALFRIASHSKMFTSVAALRLRDAGRLQLDEPVRRQLAWFQLKTAAPDSPEITLRHILTHTAGLPREAPFPYWSDLEFPEIAKVKDGLAGQEPAYAAETKWKYSNLGMAVAGLLVEKASGRSYRDYVTAEILSPLGMASTSAGAPPPDLRGRMAMGYGRRMPDGSRERIPFVDARGMDPAAGFCSSAGDLLRFLSWQVRLREGGKAEVLKPSTLREMQRVHWLREDWKSAWGLGFAIRHTPERDLVGHGGAYPGYTTVTLLSPAEKVGVVVLTNATDGDPVRYARQAFEWVAPALAKAAGGPVKVAEPDPSWRAYVGTYRSRWGDTKVLVLNGKLVAIVPLNEDFMDAKLVLLPAGTHTFRVEGQGFGVHGEQARFEVDATGKATRLFLGVNYTDRIDGGGPTAGKTR